MPITTTGAATRHSESTARYFHVTFRKRVASIYQKGLTPGRRRNWSNPFGGKLGDPKAIYLFSNYAAAVRWASHMEWEFREKDPDIVILVLHNPPGELLPDENQAATSRHGLKTKVAIPAENIENVVPLTRDLKRAFVAAQNADRELTYADRIFMSAAA